MMLVKREHKLQPYIVSNNNIIININIAHSKVTGLPIQVKNNTILIKKKINTERLKI